MKNTLAQIAIGVVALSLMGAASANTTKAEYKAAEAQAKATYKTDAAKCDELKGDPKDVCVAEAKAARTKTEAEAKAAYKGTVKAATSARKDIAGADYKVAEEKCEMKTGNAKDVCMKEAKAAKITAVVDAKADKKVIDARVDAHEDKVTAAYKVATEKCDALSGAPKDSCIVAAKKQYGK